MKNINLKKYLIPCSLLFLVSMWLVLNTWIGKADAAFVNGYSYCKVVTTSATMVSGASDLTNYPLTVILTDTDLKTTGNGGLVNNASGFDIGFGPDCSGSGTMLKWEMESYVPTTGAIVAHVLRPTLSHTTNDTIGMYYGASFSTFQSTSSAVWDANYKGVWHLPDGTALTVLDSTGVNNGTKVGTVTAVAGKIDGGANNVTAGANGIRINDNVSLRIASKLTVSAWVNPTSRNANGSFIIQKRDPTSAPNNYNYGVYLDSAGKLSFGFNDGAYRSSVANTAVGLSGWHYVTVAVDETAATKIRYYLDGAADGTPAYAGTMPSGGSGPLQMTNYDQFSGGTFQFNGTVDEVRVSNINRPADWILTEYRNQNAPGTYISVGARQTPAPVMTILPVSIPSNYSGNITLTLTGAFTLWVNGTTVMTATGVSGTACGDVAVSSNTAATLTCTTGSTTGTLTLTESVTGTTSATVSVGAASMSISPAIGNTGTTPTITLTGVNTLWLQTPVFTVTGGTGASLGSVVCTTNTACSATLTVGSLAGTLTLTDTKSGAVATFNATVPAPSFLAGATAPIGFGTGTLSPGMLNYLDWNIATPSGCSTAQGAGGGSILSPTRQGMCVGGRPTGDTIYFTGWFADASQLPITTGLPIVGTLNDFTMRSCSGNIAVIQLAEFDWSNKNASRIFEVNCMSSYNSGINVPAGWFGHCTSNDASPNCVWHSRSPFVRGGLLYLPIFRQIQTGTASTRDSTMIVSADGGKTWKNPYTVAHGGAARADGDAPLCGAATAGVGNPCTDATYPATFMWPAVGGNFIAWQAVQYGQDGATPQTGITDGCDPAIYTCFIGDPIDRAVARVLNTDLPSLDVTKWQYYTCPAITSTYRCPGSDPASWTSVFADRTVIGPTPSGIIWSNPVAYIKEFKTYLLTGGTSWGPLFATASAIEGPWEIIARMPQIGWGFEVPMLATGYTVVGTNPPHIKITTIGDTKLHAAETSPQLAEWDLVLGRTPMFKRSEDARYSNISGTVSGSGLVISDNHAPGTIPKKDLVWAFDFYDHGGDTVSTSNGNNLGFREIANGSAFIMSCHGPGQCGDWNPGQGTSLQTFGATVQGSTGYVPNLVTATHETPQTVAIGATKIFPGYLTLTDAPAVLQGNGTYTVAGIFRYGSSGSVFNKTAFWQTGGGGASTSVGLQFENQPTAGGNLELGWGSPNANRWRFNSGFTMVTGNWYFIAVTVQANGATPIAHMWIGNAGAVVDKIAGVSRVSTGGTPAQTPSVTASPMTLGLDVGWGLNGVSNTSYGGLYVYGRALGQAEVGLMYNTLKASMAKRGVTVQ